MKGYIPHFSIVFFISLLLFMISCSSGKYPVEPDKNIIENPPAIDFDVENHNVIAAYDSIINPLSGTFTVEAVEREATFHFPLTQWYPDVLEVVDYGFTPNFWADIRLTHPLPGSGHDAFDPRVIAIIPATPGNSFNYPVFNVIGNNKVLLNYDDYTKLYDELGGGIPGNTNPYKAYFKDQDYRRWSSIDPVSETQRWEMNLSGFGGPLVFKLVVVVATSYPEYPEPSIDNAPEPVQIDVEIGAGLTSSGGSAIVTVTLKDWQGYENIKCKVESLDLFNGAVELEYLSPGLGFKEYIFTGNITNELHAPEGQYNVLISAWDIPSDIHIFDESPVSVAFEPVFDPVDITPPWLKMRLSGYFVEGNYLYIVDHYSGLMIFDISNITSTSPVPLGFMETYTAYNPVFSVSGIYAYIPNEDGDLMIINVEHPESPYLVNTVDLPVTDISGIVISSGYAYLTVADNGLYILDIDPPQTASVLKQVFCSALDVVVSNGYAYIAGYDSGFHIIDVDPIDSAYLVKTVNTLGYAYQVSVSGNYAYVAEKESGIQIIDISIPESAYVLNTVVTQDDANDVISDGEYAYVADNDYLLEIIDVNPPQTANIVNTVDMNGRAQRLQIIGEHVYVYTTSGTICIVDIYPQQSAQIVRIIPSMLNGQASGAVYVDGDYLYAVGSDDLHIINVEIPEKAYIINSVIQPENILRKAKDIFVQDGYAYFSHEEGGFYIIDVDPPETAYTVKHVTVGGYVSQLDIVGEYLYLACADQGLMIFDIHPPEETHLIGSCDTPYEAYDVVVEGEYAFVADTSSIQIIDITPPQTPWVVKSLESFGQRIAISNGYAFTVNGMYNNFQIYDIDPLDSAYQVKYMTVGRSYNLRVQNGYAYIASQGGIGILDIDPPESAYVIRTFPSPACDSIFVSNQYAYTSGSEITIVKLW